MGTTLQSPLGNRTRGCLIIALGLLAILLILGTTAFAALKFANKSFTIGNLTIGGSSIQPTSTGIGITTAPDGEHIGISDGTYAFDTGRNEGALKTQAAAALKKGDVTNAELLWKQAMQKDTTDAEPLIYLEDQQVLSSGKPYITLVVATMLSGDASNLSTGRDSLQGAYIAQKEYNDGSKLGNVQVYLLIASAGGNSDYATTVSHQIVQAAQHDHHIVGVMGWPYSSYVAKSYSILANAHIPMVSPDASSDTLTNISPYFFRVAPTDTAQATAGAQYAEQQLGATRAALFVDPHDTYSQSLASAFTKQFTAHRNQIVVTKSYTKGKTDNLNSLLLQALGASPSPNLIYFAGYAADMSVLLTDLPTSATNVQLMGGDALYQLGGYTVTARAGFERLHFTAFAYPDEWGIQKQANPPFFTSYAYAFDPSGTHPGTYGYSRADSDAILSYDATITLLQGSKNVLGNGTSTTPDALRQGLAMITGSQAIQGISGQISFGSNGDPQNKSVVILRVNPVGQIQIVPDAKAIQGCFFLGNC
jgi:ABC-type branched-subunit amino acid transport system substrate-binding protein